MLCAGYRPRGDPRELLCHSLRGEFPEMARTQARLVPTPNSGAVINASLIIGLNGAGSVAASGGFLYVITSDGKIGKYTTSGATVNAFLVTGLNQPTDIEVSGNQIFVADFGNGSIGKSTDLGSNYQLFSNQRCTLNRHRSIRHTFCS